MEASSIVSGSFPPTALCHLFRKAMLGIAKADVQLVFTSVSIPIIKILQYSHACWLIPTASSHWNIPYYLSPTPLPH